MIAVFAWLVGSKAGRVAVVIALGVALAALVVARAFRQGQSSEKARQTQATLAHVRDKVASDESIARLDPSARRQRLREWTARR